MILHRLTFAGGENIVPKDIEDFLTLHPEVKNAAVVGVTDPKWGENVVAFVEPEQVEDLSVGDLKSFLRSHNLAAHKMPAQFFVVGGEGSPLSTLPINANGKVLKTELRDIAESKLKPI